MFKSLSADKHPDKTWLDRAKAGFDFLGFRIIPTSIKPSAASVSRLDKKVARLYEQGASKKRIGLYLGRWLLLGVLVPGAALANSIVFHDRATPPHTQVDLTAETYVGALASGSVCANEPITAMALELDITHSYTSDLRITLMDPSNATADVWTNESGRDLDSVFTSNGTGAGRDYPFSKVIDNASNFSGLVSGSTGAGNWELTIQDTVASDVPIVNHAELHIGCASYTIPLRTSADHDLSAAAVKLLVSISDFNYPLGLHTVAWTQSGGPMVNIVNPTSQEAAFTPACASTILCASETYMFDYTVTRGGFTESKTVTVLLDSDTAPVGLPYSEPVEPATCSGTIPEYEGFYDAQAFHSPLGGSNDWEYNHDSTPSGRTGPSSPSTLGAGNQGHLI